MDDVPTLTNTINYGKQTIDDTDIEAVSEVLKENKFLTTGPRVSEFERKICEFVGCKYAVAVNSGTAALHCAIAALDLKSTDEVIVTTLSFVASANCVLYCGAKPILCDIEEETLNIDPNKLENLITKNTKAIVAVDFTGQPFDYHKVKNIANKYNLVLIQDAAHSIGCEINNCPNNKIKVGSYSDMTTFSFHPVKNMTTGEGGMITTNNESYYLKLKNFRSHGISIDYKQREKTASHYYEMTHLGYNYRICDILCGLGINQLKKLPDLIKRRQEIAKIYDKAFKELKEYITPLTNKFQNAYHIYVIKLNLNNFKVDRDNIFKQLKKLKLGVNVHYLPIHLHPYYKDILNPYPSLPISEKIYNQIITLPLYPTMTLTDIDNVIKIVKHVCYLNKKL
jgi:perosamine synthetase